MENTPNATPKKKWYKMWQVWVAVGALIIVSQIFAIINPQEPRPSRQEQREQTRAEREAEEQQEQEQQANAEQEEIPVREPDARLPFLEYAPQSTGLRVLNDSGEWVMQYEYAPVAPAGYVFATADNLFDNVRVYFLDAFTEEISHALTVLGFGANNTVSVDWGVGQPDLVQISHVILLDEMGANLIRENDPALATANRTNISVPTDNFRRPTEMADIRNGTRLYHRNPHTGDVSFAAIVVDRGVMTTTIDIIGLGERRVDTNEIFNNYLVRR